MKQSFSTALRVLSVLLAVLLAAAALVYFTGVVYFRTHFPFRTSFLGYDVSQCETDVIDEIMQAETDAVTLTILEMDGQTETMALSADTGYRRTAAEPTWGWIPAGLRWTWPMSLRTDTVLPCNISFTYDRERLEESVSSLAAMDPERVKLPENARLAWQDGVCVLVPESDGNALYVTKTVDALARAIEEESDTVDLVAEDCYRKARIRSDNPNLRQELARYQAINFQRIEIDMTGDTVVLTPDDILAFYDENENGELSLRDEEIVRFVEDLKERYDTYERQRPFVNSYGNEILVGTRADTYGFKLDRDETIALLTETLTNRERLAQIEPVWINKAWAREENGCDVGDTYIEISIADQYLWSYIDGELQFGTSVVTGNTGNHDTPRGVFRILMMQRDVTLVGDDYASPVSFWMPFSGNVGLHDATWRTQFGGSLYKSGGSHGCVNLPIRVAKTIYENIDAESAAVIVYKLEGTESSSTSSQSYDDIASAIVSALDEISDSGAITSGNYQMMKKRINWAKAAYSHLSAAAQSHVTNYDKLVEAVSALNSYERSH